MLPPFIIEQIRRREEEERRQHEREQPRLELPVDAYRSPPRPSRPEEDREPEQRGIIILDLG